MPLAGSSQQVAKDDTNSVFTVTNLQSILKTSEESQKNEDYVLSEHRNVEGGTSTYGAFAHLLKSSLGAGILAMPMAFYNAGLIFGVIGTLCVGFLCTYCVDILVRTSQNICREIRVPYLSFAETVEKVFERGPKRIKRCSELAKEFVDWSLIATYYAAICVYIVFIATSFHDVINFNLGLNTDIRIYIALILIPCLLIGQIRQLNWLVPFSALANLFILITFGITLYYIFNDDLIISGKPYIAKLSQIPLFFSTVIFAMEGIGVVMPVENSMRKPEHFLGCPGVLNFAMSIVIALYTLIGFLGYIRFGDEVRGSVTLNLPPGHPLADAAKILMALAILFTFGLQFYIPNDILWQKISSKFQRKHHNIAQIALRCFATIAAGGISAAVPNLEPFISLVGSIFFSILGIFVPSLMETIYLWPNNLGIYKWKLVKNILLGSFAILAMLTGASVSIVEIVDIYK